jgi:cystathionine beta-synthase
MEGGESKGSVQEAQLVELFVQHKDPKQVKVAEIMSQPFPTVEADAPLESVASLLTRENPAVLVKNADGGLGIITKYDLISHIAR